jgi:hypothetical protein
VLSDEVVYWDDIRLIDDSFNSKPTILMLTETICAFGRLAVVSTTDHRH